MILAREWQETLQKTVDLASSLDDESSLEPVGSKNGVAEMDEEEDSPATAPDSPPPSPKLEDEVVSSPSTPEEGEGGIYSVSWMENAIFICFSFC